MTDDSQSISESPSEQVQTSGSFRGSPLLDGLTEAQQQAVITTEGPVLVLAAAGSGKTRVITRRAAFLVREVGIPPWQILCITFTNKAAGEMRQRIAALLGERDAKRLTMGTFHALCAKLLRQYAEAAGLKPDFTIYDSDDQQRAMKQAFKDLDISSQHFTPSQVLHTVSNAKNQLIDAAAFAATASDFYSRTVARIYKQYAAILERCGALDFDDLLLNTARVLQKDETTRKELQDRYQYVQIDEYQDTNHAQFVIAHTLADGHRNLCVVGDPDQSIYGWRGANIRNILEFEQHYPDAKVIELGQNYRSTPQILKIADTLIRNNRQRRHKNLFTENPPGDDIVVIQCGDEEHEARQVLEFLRKHNEAGVPWGEMAVFYRMNSLSRTVEDALMREGIPYQVARGTAFYERKEIKDALAYMRLLANENDEVSITRVINTPTRGIGDTTVEHIQAYAVANGLPLWEALRRAPQIPALSSRAITAVSRFTNMVDQWRQKIATADERALGFVPGVRDVVEMILRDSGLETFYKEEKTADEAKLANLYELVTAGQRFDETYAEEDAKLPRRLLDYLEQVSLVADVDALQASGGAVTLMTLHAAKGLEFPVVCIVGLEERLLPHQRAMDSPSELEEERRLCFVGITRAQKHLMMSHARYRTIRGLRERTVPSQFLREFGKEGITFEDRSGYGTNPFGGYGGDDDFLSPRPNFAPAEAPRKHWSDDETSGGGLDIGVLVKHPQFGLGRVMQLTPTDHPTRAKVQFQRAGLKTLVLEYARLEIVDDPA
jgi:DNA helicase-2/ATP-dependent DNA helicase PcrA